MASLNERTGRVRQWLNKRNVTTGRAVLAIGPRVILGLPILLPIVGLRDMRTAGLGLLMLTASGDVAAHAACGAIGATYAPRSTLPSFGIRYRMTIVAPPPGAAMVAERYRFELFSRRSGRRLSSILLDNICGMGRAPCATWQPGKAEGGFFHSVVVKLNADFSPVSDWRAAHAIVFPGFSDSDWTTPLALGHHSNVRYYSHPHVEPDLSGQTIWIRIACGRR